MNVKGIVRLSPLMMFVLVALLITRSGGVVVAAAPNAGGFRALSGQAAADFTAPGDMELVRSFSLAGYGLTYERYQQFYGEARAEVLGGQITLYRDGSGTVITVIGAHYPNIVPNNSVALTPGAARRIVERDIGAAGERTVELLIDPDSGRFFYRAETRRFDSRWIHWIDAGSGAVLNKFDALATNDGKGVKGDTKDMTGLTTPHSTSGHGATGSHFDLASGANYSGRQVTYDKRNKNDPFLYYVTDSDNHWTLVTSDRKSPGHPALIDAQYYAKVTDDYLVGRHGFNWTNCYTAGMQSIAHYGRSYNNAFWNGTYTVYGDGDGSIFRELSGGLDVVAHEHTHGVTDCTSNLIYQDESGALNESFSDMLGNGAEFFANEPTLSSCVTASGQSVCADWWIGEDVYLPSDAVPGFRNMADPAEDGDPDHYSERQIGGGDNGGVHTNSGIPNHAYYLLVNGGKNAGEARGHSHAGPLVTDIGLADAEGIFFLAFIGLPQNATMCNARAATEAVASSPPFGSDPQHGISTTDAWAAVGVTDAACGGSANTQPAADNKAVTTGQGTAVAITLAGSDAEQCELNFSIVTGPTNGNLSAIADAACTAGSPNTDSATVTYTPDSGFTGSDSFTYKVNDGTLDSNTATVSITVNSTAGAPGVLACAPDGGSPGAQLTVAVTGSNFQNGATADFGDRIMVQSLTFVSSGELNVQIKVHPKAASGSRRVTVTNPDGQSGWKDNCFTVH